MKANQDLIGKTITGVIAVIVRPENRFIIIFIVNIE